MKLVYYHREYACVKNLKALTHQVAFTVLEELLSKSEICIAVKERLTKDSGVAGDSYYDNIVHKLMAKPSARGL
ncbi:hypothetical protein AVEN_170096-1 [Araneus ventricosus]|uniref:Uncharacterized protein n=1 Tax=Araneus ventricosus TaxID=182803 RepID=A0A4Y2M8U1_ARAVE|nr:hypothetical protein AVEN_170096-1 [Araneus ventricosus]